MLNLRPSQDKRWRTHHRLAAEGWMSADIAIYREFNPGEVRWDAETNEIVGSQFEMLWTGRARVQPNKDWRARSVESASDPEMVQYIRVQIPLKKDGPVPHLNVADIIRVLPPDPAGTWEHDRDLESWIFRVRNTGNSSNNWLRNILCGTDLSAAPAFFDDVGSS